MWPSGVGAGTALWVIEQALDSDDEDIQEQAVGVLERNAKKTVTEGAPLFPRQLTRHRWPTAIPLSGRRGLLRTLAVMAGEIPADRRFNVWPEFMRLANRALANDDDARLRADAGVWLQTLVVQSGIDRTQVFHGSDNERGTPSELFDIAEVGRNSADIVPSVQIFSAMGNYADRGVAESWIKSP